jgi:glycine C-acetyltransferase
MSKADLKYLIDELQQVRGQKLYQKLRVLETEQLPVARFDGHEVINLSSNNYLGLTTHPKLRQRAHAALEQFGVGSGAVRNIAGTMSIHLALEEKIARFKQVDAVGVFAQGIGFPTVSLGKARIRTILTATHTEEELSRALGILEKLGQNSRII